ncbi:hypothetical protein [Massilia sp. PWRC2]|uniref:hypothetical protein n=1 Tax=Massilia sp. PWRC2 TaxID=2804626 RepID=UPI003CF4AD57
MKVEYEIDGTWYHGGTHSSVTGISAGKISTNMGGGELGIGFYIGNFGHLASAWAKHKNRKDAAVAEIEIVDFKGSGLGKLELSWLSAKEKYINIRLTAAQRTFKFGKDVIAAPIVGKAISCAPVQLKWEGSESATYLNSPSVAKVITKL